MPDPIQFAHVVSSQDASVTVEGHLSATVVWQVRVNSVICAPSEILGSPQIPGAGDTWFRYTQITPGVFEQSYTKESGTENTDLRVIDVRLSQSKDDPQIWTVTFQYAGTDDPTFELPEFETQATEYQEYTNYDVTGRMVENSALDPILGGMPRDKTQKSYVITRNLPFSSWYADAAENFVNTVNSKPFALCRQTVRILTVDVPILKAPGTCRLKRVTEKQMVRVKGFSPATSSYYWRVSAEIVVDESTYPDTSTATAGGKVAQRHRFITADRGFNELKPDFTKGPIFVKGGIAVDEQFLDGKGHKLALPTDPPPVAPNLDWSLWQPGGKLITRNDYYSVQAGQTLTVAAPGVMANDEIAAGRTIGAASPPAHASGAGGSFSLNSDGSFSYKPNTGYTGWDSFTYIMSVVGVRTDSDPTTVLIRVGPQPVFLAFDRYESKDWSSLAVLLENW